MSTPPPFAPTHYNAAVGLVSDRAIAPGEMGDAEALIQSAYFKAGPVVALDATSWALVDVKRANAGVDYNEPPRSPLAAGRDIRAEGARFRDELDADTPYGSLLIAAAPLLVHECLPVGVFLWLGKLGVGDLLRVTVRNISDAPAQFRGECYGWAVV